MYTNSVSIEGMEELDMIVLEIGVGIQSDSAELVLESLNHPLYDEVEEVTLLDDAVSSSHPQSQLLLLSEDEVIEVVSSDGVDSRLDVLSWDQALDIVELE